MTDDASTSETFGFILVPGFPLMSFASATEPLRAANLVANREIYRTVMISTNGDPVYSSGGLRADCIRYDQTTDLDTVFVCASGKPRQWPVADIVPLLRQCARRRVRVGGISGGPYLLAASGLLDDRDFTVHWEHAPALIEAFPHLRPRQTRFVIDGNRITCGGGIAPLDMMHALIARRMGAAFAQRVSDLYLHKEVAASADPQTASLVERYGVNNPALLRALAKMEATIDRPQSRSLIARHAGVSTRHLDRLFQETDASFVQTYHQIRLARARVLLQKSSLSILEIAIATGFSSTGYFSRRFKGQYGMSPSELRDST
ncbi:MAG: GlxA family transcriptional regulator [Mesorhizobium sp.]|nr:MAG: GlxA family transcriptional regulator [Mesorhizobium sp.]